MPSALIDKVVQVCNIDKSKVEELWNKSKEIAQSEYGVSPSADNGKFYAVVTGIFKKAVGSECATKMAWTSEGLTMAEQLKIELLYTSSLLNSIL